jgi:hypothetical protein
MRILLLLFMLFVDCKSTPPLLSATVYICDSPGAKKYHLKESCKGLRSCQRRIIKLTLDQAKKKGRTLCGWEK